MRYILKPVIRMMNKIMMKAVAAIILVFLTIFAAAFNVSAFLFRLIALPCAGIGAIMAVYNCITAGMSLLVAVLAAGSVFAVAMYFLLPLASPVLYAMKAGLKDYVCEPLFIRSPVKFTM